MEQGGRIWTTDRIEPFRIEVPHAELVGLRQRIADARWPERETVRDWSQGVPIDYLMTLCRYWAESYDWRQTEDRLNRLPQFRTRIDGVPIHFFHLRSPQADALPLIMTHGWPGSFLEFERTLPHLVEPAEDVPAFHVVVPSLPGYGFSGRPAEPGWTIHRMARAWAELMSRLGYARFIAEGSDWGTSISTSLALYYPDRLLGLHLVPPLVPAYESSRNELSRSEQAAWAELEERSRTGSGYSAVQGTRPQTIGYSLDDSPIGLCAWMLEKIWSWSDFDSDLEEVLSRDQVLDNISLYWLTRAGASSARLYWESISEVALWFTDTVVDRIDVPAGCTVFPKEVPRPSRRQAERRFSRIVHWEEPERGGHFGAWERPVLFLHEVRAVGAALRYQIASG
jgi:pimeloyl-ACP methyl ester carboxylesterase